MFDDGEATDVRSCDVCPTKANTAPALLVAPTAIATSAIGIMPGKPRAGVGWPHSGYRLLLENITYTPRNRLRRLLNGGRRLPTYSLSIRKFIYDKCN